MNYSEWEQSVTESLVESLEIPYADASGIVEAQEFYMSQSWGQGLNSQQAAEKLLRKCLNNR